MTSRRCLRSSLALAAGFAAAAVSLLACSGEHRDAPYTSALSTTDGHIANGQVVYMRYCHQCHPGGAAGVGPALNDKPLPVWAMKFQVRHGVGAMPAFKEDRISAQDLDDLIAYEKALRSLH